MSARARGLLLHVVKIFPSWGRKFSLTRAQKWGNECSLSLIYCCVKFFDSLLQAFALARLAQLGNVKRLDECNHRHRRLHPKTESICPTGFLRIYFLFHRFLFYTFCAAKIAIAAETTKHFWGKRHRFVTNETIHFHYNKQGGRDLRLPLWFISLLF